MYPHGQKSWSITCGRPHAVGDVVGAIVGAAVGSAVGLAVGLAVGVPVGALVGFAVGFAVGAAVGSAVGCAVGFAVGEVIGADVDGIDVGCADGSELVGFAVGEYEPPRHSWPQHCVQPLIKDESEQH